MFLSLFLRAFQSMYKLFLILTVSFFSLMLHAAKVTIAGSADVIRSGVVAAFVVDDYISEKRVLLKSAEISSTGEFMLTFDLADTRAVIISINRVEGILYVTPGESYQIVFPSAETAEAKKFDRTSVEIIIKNDPPMSLNFIIQRFNGDFAHFLNDHFYDFAVNEYRGSDVYMKSLGAKITQTDLYKTSGKKDTVAIQPTVGFSSVIATFESKVQEDYSAFYDNAFFHDYVTYSMAELELMAGKKRADFYNEYFMSQSLRLHNPAFMRCFEVFYNNFLTTGKKETQGEVVKCINQERNATKLISLFQNDSAALSNQIRTLAVIKGLKDIYFNKTFTRNAIEKTLNNIPADSPELKAIAVNTYNELKKCKEGWLLDDLTLVDESENKWVLSEHHDLPTYILFYAAWNTSSMKEMQVMKNLQDKYGKFVNFVAICMDEDYADFRKYLETHTDQKFTFLFGNGDPLLTQKCNISAIPYALMIDNDGLIMYTFTRLPSQGIQMEFDKIVTLSNQSGQGPKTWKEK